MSAGAPAAGAVGALPGEPLRGALERFLSASTLLTDAYERLRARAEAVDFALARANEELRRKVEELDRVSGHLRTILESLPCGVIALDEGGIVRAVNPAAERLLGVRAADAVGRSAAALRAAAPRGGARAGARWLHLERRIAPFGQGGGSVEIITDRTEECRLEERVRVLDRFAAIGEVAAAVAHEIRNPLNGVAGFADLILEEVRGSCDPGTIGRYAERIRAGASGIAATVQNLLVLGAPERFSPRPVPLAEILEESCAGFPPGRIRLEPPPAPVEVQGEPFLLRQAFGNLVRNAFEAMGEEGQLVISWGSPGSEVAVRFRDEGPGMDAETRARACLPFFTTKPGGTGLGLALVRKLVELHRGQLEIGGEPGRGAEIVVTLPVEGGA